MNIEGKLALVTGASSGMGSAIAGALAKAGAKVVLLARNRDALQKVADGITAAGGKAVFYSVDLADADAVVSTAAQIKSEQGVPDIIVNNAGSGEWRFIDETSNEEAVSMMTLPYFAAFYITKAFYNDMVARDSGHIVNISSVGSRFVWPGATYGNSTKASPHNI